MNNRPIYTETPKETYVEIVMDTTATFDWYDWFELGILFLFLLCSIGVVWLTRLWLKRYYRYKNPFGLYQIWTGASLKKME